jgi:hypothetical protein
MFIFFTSKINVISFFFCIMFFIFELVTNYCIFFIFKAMVIGAFTLGAVTN